MDDKSSENKSGVVVDDMTTTKDKQVYSKVFILIISSWLLAIVAALASDVTWVPSLLPQLYVSVGGMSVHHYMSAISMCCVFVSIILYVVAFVLAKRAQQKLLKWLILGVFVVFMIIAIFVIPVGGAIIKPVNMFGNQVETTPDDIAHGWTMMWLMGY